MVQITLKILDEELINQLKTGLDLESMIHPTELWLKNPDHKYDDLLFRNYQFDDADAFIVHICGIIIEFFKYKVGKDIKFELNRMELNNFPILMNGRKIVEVTWIYSVS